jgi:prepilin-type N-terminal cleavage/methylation domain-containing protein
MHALAKRDGFSLLELLAVVAVLCVIIALVAPRVAASNAMSRQELHARNKAAINAAVKRYHAREGVWPAADLSDIGADAAYFPHGLPTNPVAPGTPYALDPATHRVVTP